MPGLFQGPEGGLRVLAAVAVVSVAACISSDPDAQHQLQRVAQAAQPFASLTTGTQACFRMCSWLQSPEFRQRPVERCASTQEACAKARDEVSSPDREPVIAVAGFTVTCRAAELAACQSSDDCAAFGAHQCEDECERAWPYELKAARDDSEP